MECEEEQMYVCKLYKWFSDVMLDLLNKKEATIVDNIDSSKI